MVLDYSNPPEKPKHSYIFGDFLGQVMSKVDLRTQLEAGMMSMSFMMIGLVVTAVYLWIYIDFVMWYKIFLMVNLLAGLIFFVSNLVTLYQQYQNYMEVVAFNKEQNDFKQQNINLKGGLKK